MQPSQMFRFALLVLALSFGITAAAQWKNPANRYDDAYKKYLEAACPVSEDGIKHFVYFARDRGSIRNHPLLSSDRFAGAQIMYPWRLLEPAKGNYDFSIIEEDYQYLAAHEKKLFIQLQDATFTVEFKAAPEYLISDEYDGGVIPQTSEKGKPIGWVAKRWNPQVRERFAKLLQALGERFDGKIEGINLQETAIGAEKANDPTLTPQTYVTAVEANMLALSQAFSASTKMIYANFMPGEWLPWEDEGYLKSIYMYGEEIGVSLGAPDLMVKRKGQLNHALAMMHENEFTVPLGIAIQDGNYIGMTGADFDDGPAGGQHKVQTQRKNIVPLLHAFAQDFLKVQYMFWVNQAPYFEEDVLHCLDPNWASKK
ncbi:MAG: hypothetical protein AAGB46_01490 [Verrucomicrobiota bacterium]